MKNLIFVNGTMGAGKTTVCRELKAMLPPSVCLDGDACWDACPFTVTEETRRMVMDNICFLLSGFIRCTAYENVIFGWVMHEQTIIDDILRRLPMGDVSFSLFTLMPDECALRARLDADVRAGLRQPDVIEHSVARLPLYCGMDSVKIDVSHISAREAAEKIAGLVRAKKHTQGGYHV